MEPDNTDNSLSRKKFLKVSLTLPFLPVAKSLAGSADELKRDNEFVTMLNAEGKAVRVRKDALKKAKVIEQKMSNQSLLSWLKPKGFNSK